MYTSERPNPCPGKQPFLTNLLCLWRKAKKSNKNSPPWMRLYRRFTFEELSTATNNFKLRIDADSFGIVYKGFVSDSCKDAAVKWYKPDHPEQQQFFLTEMELISSLHHQNIVSLLGYCLDGSRPNKFIVYKYMPRGTLQEQLHSRNDSQPLLSWKKRLEICIGAARGLEFLHTGNPSIIHRDIKSSNILLDHNWVVKITDFEFSKLMPTSLSEADSYVSTHVIGSIGYLDPEYARTGLLTTKSDVYSFGVVLFEVLSARKPWDIDSEEGRWGNRINWWRDCVEDGRLDEIIDPCLKGEIAPDCLKAYADMAYKCSNERGNERPTMDAVLKRLMLTLLLQESIEAGIPFSPSWLRSMVPPPKGSEPLLEIEIQDLEVSESDFEDLPR